MLLALQGNSPFWSGKPFYPQDIVAALAALPRPRMLVTTPFHLSAVLAAGLDQPAVDLLLSATAPLSARLATEAERRFAAPLHEGQHDVHSILPVPALSYRTAPPRIAPNHRPCTPPRSS